MKKLFTDINQKFHTFTSRNSENKKSSIRTSFYNFILIFVIVLFSNLQGINAQSITLGTVKVKENHVENNQKGFLFEMEVRANNLKGKNCRLILWFKDEKGNYCISYSPNHASTEGYFYWSQYFTPPYEYTKYDAYKIHIPYMELHKAGISGGIDNKTTVNIEIRNEDNKTLCSKEIKDCFFFGSWGCNHCQGTSVCPGCGGRGVIPFGFSTYMDYSCRGTGKCEVCEGLGIRIFATSYYENGYNSLGKSNSSPMPIMPNNNYINPNTSNSNYNSKIDDYYTCPKCSGTGQCVYEFSIMAPQSDLYYETCTECGKRHLNSTGHSHITCGDCGGTGWKKIR